MEECTHNATLDDRNAGYEHCMFCTETGECDGKKGYCKRHAVVWERWKEAEANARNSRF